MTEWVFVEKGHAEGGGFSYVFHRVGSIAELEKYEPVVLCSDLDTTWRIAVLAGFKVLPWYTGEQLQHVLFSNMTALELEAYANCACESGTDEELQFWPQPVWNAMLTEIFEHLRRSMFGVIQGGKS